MKYMDSTKTIEKLQIEGSKKEKKSKMLSQRSMIAIVILAILVIVGVILSFQKPSAETLRSCISVELRDSKKYSETYYNYGFANVITGNDEASKVNVAETYIGFAGTIFVANTGVMGFIGDNMRWIPVLLRGARITILLTILSVTAGIILSLFLALGKMSKFKPLSKLCSAYIFFFRGTPLLMQLYFIYYGLPLISDKLTINNQLLAAFIAFGLNSGAYCAEIIRAAIQSIDKGQFEASKALGLTYWQTMRLVIIPQSIRRLLPPVANEFIMVLKDASLVSIIALADLTYLTRKLATSNATPLVYLPAMAIYLLITAFFTYIFDRLEKKFSIYE